MTRPIDNYFYSLKGFTQFLRERSLARATADDIVTYAHARVALAARSHVHPYG